MGSNIDCSTEKAYKIWAMMFTFTIFAKNVSIMKVRKVKWHNHPVLKNMELDFVNQMTGQPYNNILLAGENGTGKTSILTTLSRFFNGYPIEYFEYIEYISEGQILKAVPPSSQSDIPNGFYNMIKSDNSVVDMRTGRNNGGGSCSEETIDNDPLNIRFSGCVLSKARADFQTETITTTTTKQLDEANKDMDDKEDFTSLKQLIVDIESQDNSEYARINRDAGDNPLKWTDFYNQSKIYRFKNAFNTFFDKIKYDRVIENGTEKTIQFTKNNTNISVDSLSTGEKQIVFRGAFLLKNNKRLNDSVIMVDEPELSMHPKWQEKILQYYKDLFTESDGTQKAQLFFATHSEHVLKEALSNKNQNLVIVLTDNAGIIENKRIDAPSVLPTITNAETDYLAFDIVSNDYHIELYGWLQQSRNLPSVKNCDNYTKAQHGKYDSSKHEKKYTFTNPQGNVVTYDTIPTYIRNCIDHPDSAHSFTEAELRTSIELLIELVR